MITSLVGAILGETATGPICRCLVLFTRWPALPSPAAGSLWRLVRV